MEKQKKIVREYMGFFYEKSFTKFALMYKWVNIVHGLWKVMFVLVA